MRSTPDDTQAFLARRLQAPFWPDDAERLHARTEGRAAALALAALALERRSDPGAFTAQFAGSTQIPRDGARRRISAARDNPYLK